jgi:1,4-dihydroxy-2-naphthoate octaprenyltransferase
MARWLRIWLLALRPASLTAALVPVLVGTAAVADETFRGVLFSMALGGSFAIQAATNLVNDFFDHVQGIDTADSPGPSGAIQRGLLSPGAVLAGGTALFAVGAGLGLAITVIVGWPVLVLGGASVLAGFFYTAPPLKLAYRALGEATVFVFMGVVIVMGAAYVQVEVWTWEAFLASLPVALLVAAILHANNLRDIEEDRAHGKATLATLLGRPGADFELAALVLGAFVCAGALVASGDAPLTGLVPFASLPFALALLRTTARSRSALALNRVLAGSAALHLLFGLLWALGFALDAGAA